MPYSIKDDEIEVFSEVLFSLPELKFKIRAISTDSLLLSSITKGVEYNYFFSKQKFTLSNRLDSINIVDCGLIIINETFVGTTEKPAYSYKNFDYRIYNTKPILIPYPIFFKKNYLNFGSYLALNFKFPKYFQPDRLSDEMVIDVRVSSKGFEEVKIVKGLNYELNAAVFNLIQATNRNWKPVKTYYEIINTVLRFHLQFIQTLSH